MPRRRTKWFCQSYEVEDDQDDSTEQEKTEQQQLQDLLLSYFPPHTGSIPKHQNDFLQT